MLIPHGAAGSDRFLLIRAPVCRKEEEQCECVYYIPLYICGRGRLSPGVPVNDALMAEAVPITEAFCGVLRGSMRWSRWATPAGSPRSAATPGGLQIAPRKPLGTLQQTAIGEFTSTLLLFCSVSFASRRRFNNLYVTICCCI